MINQNSKAERGSGSATGSQSISNHSTIRGGSPSGIRPTKKIDMVAAAAARLTQSAGGSRVAQDVSAIYAKSLLREGRSGATAVQLGYQIIALAMGHFADQPETTTHKTTLAERIERSGA